MGKIKNDPLIWEKYEINDIKNLKKVKKRSTKLLLIRRECRYVYKSIYISLETYSKNLSLFSTDPRIKDKCGPCILVSIPYLFTYL